MSPDDELPGDQHLPWDERLDLSDERTWLLEASAGTGKTYQIAGIFLRLVAEYGLSVEHILTITFTNAATAELRERIRARLRLGLDTLRGGPLPDGDVVIERLEQLPNRDQVEKRLEDALRAFDLAPISTIHGFAQRMLSELAFDSGQDTGLELVTDAGEVVTEIACDTLATSYADVSADVAGFLSAAGVTKAALIDVAQAMSAATEPRVAPAGEESLAEAITRVRAWTARVGVLRERWRSRASRDALALLASDADGKGRVLQGEQKRYVEGSVARIDSWLGAGAPHLDKSEPAVRRLRRAHIENIWGKTPEELHGRPWWPLIVELDEFLHAHDAIFESLAPLAAYARTVRGRVEAELLRRRALTFDGILSRLAERIEQTGGASSPLAARIRERFRAVLVDEFQDTDQAQWSVLHAAFHERRRLFLIGDPKQAIYAFRGADVHVYLAAARLVERSRRRTMTTNFRSDSPVVSAMNALFRQGSRAFDEADIDYVEVTARHGARLAPASAGLSLRFIDARVIQGGAGLGIPKKDVTLAARLATREALAWLSGERGQLVDEHGPREVEPRDLAVLVSDHFEGATVRRALSRAGIPAVAASKGSVFDARAADWLATWLDAVAGGGRDRSARAAAVTPLFGWTADELGWALAVADRGEAAEQEAHDSGLAELRDYAAWVARLASALERWDECGFARTFDREADELGVFPRLLAMPEGERHATDLRHLFELLHAEDRARRPGPGTLSAWLRSRRNTGGEEAAQRLESDARAVSIETVHASKGLEYGIVLVPFGWSVRNRRDDGAPFLVRDDGAPTLHAEPRGSRERAAALARRDEEQRREELRRMYVALTRAKHHVVAWYGPIGSEGMRPSATALGRLLLRAPGSSGFDDDSMPDFSAKSPGGGAEERNPAWEEAQRRLDALCAKSAGAIEWHAEEPLEPGLVVWNPPASAPPEPGLAPWPSERAPMESPFRVTSYSGLVGAFDRDEKLEREVAASTVTVAAPPAEDARSLQSRTSAQTPATFHEYARLLGGGGRRYGTLVHEVLEALDFPSRRAKDGRALEALIGEAVQRSGLTKHAALGRELVERLPSILETPLDSTSSSERPPSLPRGFTLGGLRAAERFDEVPFDLRLGAGTGFSRAEPTPHPHSTRPGCADPARLTQAFELARDSCDPTIRGWFALQVEESRRGRPLIGELAGILTGSIDLVFRTADGRYFLADYKTNRIGDRSAGAYAHGELGREMSQAGYPLQALLYTLALHRHLRARLRGYDYDRHLGGYLYLFLRGMGGADTPRDAGGSGRCLGVFGDRFAGEVIRALDEAFDAKGVAT